MIKEIFHNGQLIALVFKKGENEDMKSGINFITKPSENLQVGILKYSKGHLILPHVHKFVERKILQTQEMLYVEEGKMRINFFTEDNNRVGEELLEKGDFVALLRKGHGMEIVEDSKIIYVKQGPYINKEIDKIVFEENPQSDPIKNKSEQKGVHNGNI